LDILYILVDFTNLSMMNVPLSMKHSCPQMVKKMDGFGYKELYAFDCENYQVEVDAKIAAAEAVK